ncbi:MAG: hypothetical protein K2Q22_00955 [Cytophagales bacterium]|nr:hypothetical protein [Cytophagales bacterium]
MNVRFASLISFLVLAICIGCSKTDPVPGVTNAISYKLDGTDYASPATYTLTTQTVLGATFTQVAISSLNSSGTSVSLTFGFSSSAITGYVGLATSPTSTYNLTSLPNTAYKGLTKATAGTLTITSYDAAAGSLSGTFSFSSTASGSSFSITNGVLTNVKKI